MKNINIKSFAFYGCSNLKDIVLPKLDIINEGLFENCINLESVKIHEGLKTISVSSFSGCLNLTNVILNDEIEVIGHLAFYGCEKLKNITLPNKLISIGKLAFSDCISLNNIFIPKSVKFIDKLAFYGCKNLKYIEFEDKNNWKIINDNEEIKIDSSKLESPLMIGIKLHDKNDLPFILNKE